MIDTTQEFSEFLEKKLFEVAVIMSIFDSIVYLTLLELSVYGGVTEELLAMVERLKENRDFYRLPTKAVDYPGLPAATLHLCAMLSTEPSQLTPQAVNAVAETFSQLLSQQETAPKL